jgi:hypothetical protein
VALCLPSRCNLTCGLTKLRIELILKSIQPVGKPMAAVTSDFSTKKSQIYHSFKQMHVFGWFLTSFLVGIEPFLSYPRSSTCPSPIQHGE